MMQQGLVRIALTSIVCILLMLLVARLRSSIPAGEGRGRATAADIQPVGDVFAGVEVRQEFPAEGTRIRSIELQLATHGRRNRGTLTLQVSRRANGRWQELAVRTMFKRHLRDSEWQAFGFAPPLEVKYGQQIALTLTADRNPENAITWWTSPGTNAENHRLLFNGVPRDGHAHFSVEYEPLAGKAGYRTMRPRLWRRLTVFLEPLGQAMLVSGFLLALFGLVHLSMHAPAAQPGTKGEVDAAEVGGLIDYLRRRRRPRT